MINELIVYSSLLFYSNFLLTYLLVMYFKPIILKSDFIIRLLSLIMFYRVICMIHSQLSLHLLKLFAY